MESWTIQSQHCLSISLSLSLYIYILRLRPCRRPLQQSVVSRFAVRLIEKCRFAGLKSLENSAIANIFSSRFHLFCFTDLSIFWGLGGPFFKHSGSCDTTFSLFWWPLGARMHSDGTRIDFQWFLMDFGSPIGDHSGSLFHIFSDLSSPKSHLDSSRVFCWFLNGNSCEFWCPNPSKVM